MKRPRLISPHFGGYLFGIAYQNADKTIPHQNPIRLNAKGAVLLYGADIQEVRDINNNVVNLPLDDGYCYFVDKYGKPLANGKVYTYFYQSTVPKESFDNNGQLNTNPIILDDEGKAQINMDGNYRLRIYDKDGVCMGDDDDIIVDYVEPIIPIKDGEPDVIVNPIYYATAYNRLTLSKTRSNCGGDMVGESVSYTHEKAYNASSNVSQDDAQAQADALAQADKVAFEAEAHTLAQENADSFGKCYKAPWKQDIALVLYANFGTLRNALNNIAELESDEYLKQAMAYHNNLPSTVLAYDNAFRNVLRDGRYYRDDGLIRTIGGEREFQTHNTLRLKLNFPSDNLLDKLFYLNYDFEFNGEIKDIIAYDFKTFVKKNVAMITPVVQKLREYIGGDKNKIGLSETNLRNLRFVGIGWDIEFYLQMLGGFNHSIVIPEPISNYSTFNKETLDPYNASGQYLIKDIDDIDFPRSSFEYLFSNAKFKNGDDYNYNDDDKKQMFEMGYYQLSKVTSAYEDRDIFKGLDHPPSSNGFNGVLSIKLLYEFEREYSYYDEQAGERKTAWANTTTSIDLAQILINAQKLVHTYQNNKLIDIFNLE